MRIIIIGANGQLGYDLVRVLKSNHEIIGLTHKDIEITDKDSCTILQDFKPDVVINTAAFHNVLECEKHPEKAFQVNAIGAKNVAEISLSMNSIVIYISTDYVFDGTKSEPYTEEDRPNPLNAYAISKLSGEFFTRYNPRHYIVRVASLFGIMGSRAKGGTNFIETIIRKAKLQTEIKVVKDIWMSPTYTFDAATIIKKIIELRLPYGTYHVVNSGYCSWYEFAEEIFNMLGFQVRIVPQLSKEIPSIVRRPRYSPLRSIKLERYGITSRHWKDALKAYLIEKGYIKHKK